MVSPAILLVPLSGLCRFEMVDPWVTQARLTGLRRFRRAATDY
jgi:hypothetical protein